MSAAVERPPPHTFLPPSPLCVALDSGERTVIESLARSTHESVGVLKIGLTSFVAHGPGLVRDLSAHKPVFLDLKLHDIPAQVEGAVLSVNETGASFVTVHASGGSDMVRAAAGAASDRVAVLAVTILTSLDEASLSEIGISGPPEKAVLKLAEMALEVGADGLVCSPLEVASVRERFGPAGEDGPILVVPGIRPSGSAVGDQRRTLGPPEAMRAGADVIVVGRPITAAADPAAAAAEIVRSIEADG